MNRRNENAITLIALVVTIVVLLILAGVSIAMLTGENGIITQAQSSKNENKRGEIEEQVRLAVMAAKTAGLGEIDYPTLNSELKEIGYNGEPIPTNGLPAIITIKGINVTINEDSVNTPTLPEYVGQTYETETEVTVGTEKVIVPGGATISGIAGEYENVDDGLVIYIIPEEEKVTDWKADADNNGIIDVQEKYDQFVWVPVPNAIAVDKDADSDIDTTDIDLMIAEEQYPMAIATGTTTDDDGNTIINYRGVLYDLTEATDTEGKVTVGVTVVDSSTSLSYREPAYLIDRDKGDASSLNTAGITESLLQTEFNTMVEKVSENKGFWVGRYETSNMSSSNTNNLTQQMSVIKGTTSGVGGVRWYTMYVKQKNYSTHANITSTSSMIWGSQWDQMMIWMKEVENAAKDTYYVINALTMGNFRTNDDSDTSILEPAKTGNSENYRVKNIYDLGGNVGEWTLEGYFSAFRVIRGHSCFSWRRSLWPFPSRLCGTDRNGRL